MNVIFPYRLNGTWVFDDAAVGLNREPFVCGIPEIIDSLVAAVPGAERRFKVTFSASPFPGSQIELVWLREESGGNWYRLEGSSREGWLCPALFRYFDEAPARIYCRIDAAP